METKPAERRFTGAGGRTIATYHWLPDGKPRDHLIIAHGYAEHAMRYQDFADFFVPLGYAVHALDHHGHGKSEGLPAVIESFAATDADLDTLIDQVRNENGVDTVKLVGHSMGGSIATHYALTHQTKLSGLVLSGPAIGGGVPPITRALLRLFKRINPAMGVTRLDSAAVSRDGGVVDDYRADPLVFRGKVPASTASSMMDAIAKYKGAVKAITVPTLYMHGAADALVRLKHAHPVARRFGSSDMTEKVYDGLYHEIFNEPEREQVLTDLANWLSQRPAN